MSTRRSNAGDDYFLNETCLNGKNEFDNTIKLWMTRVIDWKALCPKELGNKISVVVANLDRVDLKALMKDVIEKCHCALLPLMIRLSRGNLGNLNTESFVECVNSASKIVMGKGNYIAGNDTLNELPILQASRKLIDSHRH